MKNEHRSDNRHARIAVACALVLLACSAAPATAAPPCCGVTEIAAGGLVTAKENQGARSFQFQVTDSAMLRSLKVGAPVYANFDTGQVSLDGRQNCCRILRIATAKPAAPAAAAPAPAPVRTPAPAPAQSQQQALASAPQIARINSGVPKISFGAVQMLPQKDWKDGPDSLMQVQNKAMLQLHGFDAIKKATGIPQEAKDMLWLQARALGPEALDDYIVVPQQAADWAKSLPPEIRDKLRKAASDDGKPKKKGCSTKHISMGCVKNEVSDAIDDATKTAQKALKDIEDEWARLVDNVAELQSCFQEKTLTATAPVKFFLPTVIPVSFQSSSQSSNRSGSASGRVTGTITVGLPVEVDSRVEFSVFYIPCMPFAVRPKSLGADGKLDVDGIFNANVVATGEFDQLFTVPPAGGVQIPVAVIPVVIAGVPVAVVDVSVYLDGTLRVDGNGKIEGNVLLHTAQQSRFKFSCSGHGCDVNTAGVPAPVTSVESVRLDGRIRIKPAIYAALSLGLNYKMLVARAGPQPFLLGQVHGCGAAYAVQSSDGSSASGNQYALAADLDWGIEVRAEALAGGQKVANTSWPVSEKHIWFKDLVGSTAFIPIVAGPNQARAGMPANFTMRMPACYPYADTMKYRMQWTGNASSAASTARRSPSGCTAASGQNCTGAPMAETAINLTWPAAGNYTLTVTPREDAHGRSFDASRAASMQVTVQP